MDLVEWFNHSVSEENHHPLIVIGIFIVVFLAIHRFEDGNGRLSRVLATLIVLRVCCNSAFTPARFRRADCGTARDPSQGP